MMVSVIEGLRGGLMRRKREGSMPSWGNELWLSRRQRAWISRIALVAALVLTLVAVLTITAWPSAMVIRSVFEHGGAQTVEEMLPYVPDAPLEEHLNLSYAGQDPDAAHPEDMTLDVYAPVGDEALPTIVWVHGGAWISGSKENVVPYLKILANEGYTTVALNYTLGPEGVYPLAVDQLNAALGWLNDHADEFRIDPDRIILAGDSAGAQLASQLAALSTNAEYAELLDVEPALAGDQLVGVVLNCGVYDLQAMAELNGIVAWGFQIALWAYTGTRDWSAEPPGSTMSTIHFVTDEFPATFITGGNGDGLTWLQSIPMHSALRNAGVDATALFWPADFEPALPHEYQFHLDVEAAHVALEQTIEFLDRVSR